MLQFKAREGLRNVFLYVMLSRHVLLLAHPPLFFNRLLCPCSGSEPSPGRVPQEDAVRLSGDQPGSRAGHHLLETQGLHPGSVLNSGLNVTPHCSRVAFNSV